MELKKIRELINIIEDTDISEINIEDKAEDINIKIKRGQEITPVEQLKQSVPQNTVNTSSSKPQGETIESESVQQQEGEEILAPMVGTFYRSPSPEADPFVEVGDKVNSGETLCIIEAMKLMNEIEAEKNGEIIDILIEDGEPVEYGQPMFIIESV